MSSSLATNVGDGKVGHILDWLMKYANNSDSLAAERLLAAERSTDSSTALSACEDIGYISRSVRVSSKDSSNAGNSDSLNDRPTTFIFLSDWQRLWDSLKNDNTDVLADYLSLFRAAMALVFHRRMIQLMYIIYVWMMILFIILQGLFSRGSTGDSGSNFVSVTFEFAVYMIVCAMMKGVKHIRPSYVFGWASNRKQLWIVKLFCADPSSTSFDDTTDREIAQEAIDQKFPLSATLRRLWRRGKAELHNVLRGDNSNATREFSNAGQTISTGHSEIVEEKLYYYDWMNLSLKVLIRDFGVDAKQINFNRFSYRFMTLFALLLYPVYVTIADYYNMISNINAACYGNKSLGVVHSCRFYAFQFFFSFFGIAFIVDHILYGVSAILALVGLAYGGEIAFRMSEAWILKYHSLRRIKVDLAVVSDNKGLQDTNKEDLKTENEIIMNNGKHIRSPAKRLSAISQATVLDTWTLPDDALKMQKIIRRDAVEHYFLISALLRTAGQIWSPIMLLFIFLDIYISLAGIIFLVSASHTSSNLVVVLRYAIYIAIRFLVLIVYPILSIAFANSYFIKMYDIFQIADENDYELIGGRDQWLKVFTFAPATWTFFGLAITTKRLFAVLWAALVALASIFLSTLITQSV